MNNSFFQKNQSLYQPLINDIWSICNNPNALYLRGSANLALSISHINTPWDIDLVLFCSDLLALEKNNILDLVYYFNNNIGLNYPFIDLSIYTQQHINNNKFDFQHCLLNLNLNSQLLLGSSISEIKNINLSRKERLEILLHYLCIIDTKSNVFSDNLNTTELNIAGLSRKCKNLIKQVYRINNLLSYLDTNTFSRNIIKSLDNITTLEYSQKQKLWSLIAKESYSKSDFLFVIKVCQLVKSKGLFDDDLRRHSLP